MPTPIHTPPEDPRIVLYRGLAAEAVPLPVARALGQAERAAGRR
jgi:hypothetical protein